MVSGYVHIDSAEEWGIGIGNETPVGYLIQGSLADETQVDAGYEGKR